MLLGAASLHSGDGDGAPIVIRGIRIYAAVAPPPKPNRAEDQKTRPAAAQQEGHDGLMYSADQAIARSSVPNNVTLGLPAIPLADARGLLLLPGPKNDRPGRAVSWERNPTWSAHNLQRDTLTRAYRSGRSYADIAAIYA
jgi:hypothetical protein